MAKDQRGEETVVCVEKGFSKECPQSKPTIVKEQYVTVQPFLADTPKDYPLSKPTVEENDSVPNKDADIKHGKWFQEDCPNEYVQLKLPIEGKDSFVGEAPAKKQVKSYCSESSGKVASEEEQKCHDDPEKEERVGVLKQPQPRDIAYLSVANDESRENTREGQEEESPEQHRQWKSMQTTIEREDSASSEVSATRHVKSFLTAKPTIKASEQEWCGGRNVQGQDISNLSLAEDQRYERTRLDAEKGQIENITGREVVKIKKDREGLEIRLKSDVLLSSEEEKEWPDDCEGEHLKQPQPKGTAHSSMAKDERGADVISDQEKGLSPEYPELKDAIEKQDSVLTKDSTVNQEKSLMTGAETVQLRLEEEQTEWCGSNKKQRKQLQPKRNDQVSLDPEKHVKNSGVAEERGATTIQPGPKTEQTGRFVSDKKQRKPIFERFQPKWSAQAFMGPEESGENTGATEEKGATTVQPRPKTEQAGRFGRDKKRRKSIFERFQPTWSTRLFMGPEESGENTGAVEEKGATTVQLRLEEEQTKWNGSDKKPWKPVFERFHSKWSARVSVGPGESGENTGAAVKKESSVLSPIEEQTEFHGSDNPQLHNLEQLQPKWSDRVCVETKQGGDNTDAAQMTYPSDEHTESKTTIKEQDSAPAEDSTTNHEILMSEEDSQMESEEKQRSHSYENIQSIHIFKHLQPKGKDNLSMTMDQRSKNIVSGEEKAEPDLEVASGDDQNRCYRSESDQSLVEKTKTHGASNGVDIAKYPCEAATSFTASADAGIAASALDELVLQRIPGEIKNQRFLIKEHAMHDGPRKKTSKKKHKITKEIRAMGDTTQSSKSVSEDDYGSSLKIQDSLNLYNALVDLKKMNKILTKNNKKLENKNNALQKEISETREEISNLQDEIVKWTEEFRNLRFTLRKELEETRNILCFYKNIKKHLSEIEKQFNERVAVTQLGIYLRTRDMGLENETNSLKEFLEAQDAYIETLKIVQKLKDHLQRVELEHSKLKVKAKDQAKKIEELRGCLHNSCEKLEQDEKLTQAGAQETLGELCENTIHSPVNQTGIQTQSRWSEPTQMKTVQESNISAPESFEQQCIEELRINNALLCELYRNRRLSESCAQVHISVEQGTPLNTSGTRFALESPCVASTCPRRHFLPCENMTLPGNPRSSEDCIRSYPVEMEDEEKSIKELTKLKQYLRCNLYQQQQKNDELEKEILRIKKFLKMRKIGHEIGECSSHGNSRTGHF
ncbi:uncharacterized protein LOC110340289 [Mesocricetus auratus]|uniref:Uncharacterized protein LOC110340289 n=1 Tax=Mesocricetus auratus TaxID=10036 RepID=A0ABM2W9P6_MESAU|nr:uncharacterized protein LOC110340289 [Mesocricetus auratus]